MLASQAAIQWRHCADAVVVILALKNWALMLLLALATKATLATHTIFGSPVSPGLWLLVSYPIGGVGSGWGTRSKAKKPPTQPGNGESSQEKPRVWADKARMSQHYCLICLAP